MTSKEYEQRLDALAREIAELKRETVEDGSELPPHQRPKLNVGDTFYYVDNNGGVFRGSWYNTPWDFGRLAIGNVFRTEKAAKYAAERWKVLAEMREWAGNWDDPWVMIYDGYEVEAIPIYGKDTTFGELRFTSEKDAENCIKAVGEDRLIKYYFGVRDHEIPAETE